MYVALFETIREFRFNDGKLLYLKNYTRPTSSIVCIPGPFRKYNTSINSTNNVYLKVMNKWI